MKLVSVHVQWRVGSHEHESRFTRIVPCTSLTIAKMDLHVQENPNMFALHARSRAQLTHISEGVIALYEVIIN